MVMKKVLIFSLLASVISLLYCCGNNASNKLVTDVSRTDVLRTDMDSTADPSRDFFQYANGGWLKRNPIPSTESSWGIFQLVDLETNARLKKISEDAAKNTSAEKGSSTQLIGDFWFTGMDSASIDKMGAVPLDEEMKKIDAIKDVKGVLEMVSQMQMYRMGPFFGMYVGQDAKNSEVMALQFSQGGLGMPNRDYYFKKDPQTKRVRQEYEKYISKTFELGGKSEPEAGKIATDIMKLETSLARSSRELEDLRDPYANYHKMKVAEFSKLCPAVDWPAMIDRKSTRLNSSHRT